MKKKDSKAIAKDVIQFEINALNNLKKKYIKIFPKNSRRYSILQGW